MKGLTAATLKLLGKAAFLTRAANEAVCVGAFIYSKANAEKVIFQKLDSKSGFFLVSKD